MSNHENENKSKTPNHRQKSVGSRVVALALSATSVFGIIGVTSENAGASKSTTTTTSPEALTSKKDVKKGVRPYVSKLQIPNSNDATQLAKALYGNYAGYLNTGKEQFLNYQLVSTDSEVATKERAGYQDDQSYRAQAHSGFHRTFTINSAIPETPFTSNDTQRVMIVDYTENEYLDNRAGTPIYKQYPGYYKITLVPATRSRETASGTVTDQVWLESYSLDLGTPPTQSTSNG